MPRVLQSLIQGTFGSRDHGNFEAVVVDKGALIHWFRDHLRERFPWTRALTVVPEGVVGPGSIIQSNFGTGDVRNFEVVVPIKKGERVELWSYFRNNAAETPWQPAARVTGAMDDVAGAAAIIQSTFGTSDTGNFEVVVPLKKGERVELWHFFRNNADPALPWLRGVRVTEPQDDVLWGASLIQSTLGSGNFEVAVPLRAANGKVELWHFFRDATTLEWHKALLISDDVSGPGVLIQSDFGDSDQGNLEAIVSEHDRLVHYFRDNQGPPRPWQRGAIVTESLAGWGCLIQSNFGAGDHKNFEVLAEETNGSLVHYWRSNFDPHGPWLRWEPLIRQPYEVRLSDTRRIVQLTGEFDRSLDRREDDGSFICLEHPPFAHNRTETTAGIHGTDLGVSFLHDGKTFFMFGDTWRVNQPDAITNFDAIAFTTETNPGAGLKLTFIPGPPIIVPDVPQDEFNVPLDGVSVDGAMFVFFSTDAVHVEEHQPLMRRSILTRSTDGHRFDQLYSFSVTQFINVSVEKTTLPADEARELGLADPHVLLIWGSGRYRSSAVYLAVLPIAGLTTRAGLLFYAGQHGSFAWSAREADATPLFPAGCVGELNVRWNPFLRRYLLMYNSDNPIGIMMHTAKKPWGPWSRAPITVFEKFFRRPGLNADDPCLGAGLGKFMHVSWAWKKCDCMHDDFFSRGEGHPADFFNGEEYGAYQIAHMAKGDPNGAFTDLFFTMSTWNPYQVMLMTTRVEASVLHTPAETLLQSQVEARQRLTQSQQLAASASWMPRSRARGAVDVLRELDAAPSSKRII